METEPGPTSQRPNAGERPTLGIDRADEPARAVLTVTGEIDFYSASELEGRLTQLADEGVSEVVVDLSEVGFIDSSGLRALVLGRKALGRRGAELSLRGVTGRTQRILEMTGLASVFLIDR